MTRHSFAPLQPDAVALLSDYTGIDYHAVDFTAPNWLCVSGYDGDVLQGCMVGEFPVWFECHITLAVRDRRCITRKVMRAFFSAVFAQAVRCTAQVNPENRRALAGVRRLGFVYEGFQRKAIEGRWDALLFGMLASECRYLPGYVPVERPDANLTFLSEALQ